MPDPEASNSGALLRIEILEQQASCTIQCRIDGKAHLLSECPLATVRQAREGTREVLETFLEYTNSELDVTNFEGLDQALKALDRTGNIILFDLLGRQGIGTLLKLAQQYAARLFPADIAAPLAAPVVEIQTTGEYIHFEILPVFAIKPIETVRDPNSFRTAMRRFLAMSAIIRRTSWQSLWPDPLLHNDDGLPIRLFQNQSLPGATDQLLFFQSANNGIRLAGPWPADPVADAEFGETLARLLMVPSHGADDSRQGWIDQIHHIHCHCYTDSDTPNEYLLEFATAAGDTYRVTLADLKEAYSGLSKLYPVNPDEAPPLAFLNACGSVHTKGQPSSFSSVLHESHRGVIGTEARIPGGVAVEFANAFYRSLLSGMTVGQSLHDARWHLATVFNNPLGLLYTMYADPKLSVSQKYH